MIVTKPAPAGVNKYRNSRRRHESKQAVAGTAAIFKMIETGTGGGGRNYPGGGGGGDC